MTVQTKQSWEAANLRAASAVELCSRQAAAAAERSRIGRKEERKIKMCVTNRALFMSALLKIAPELLLPFHFCLLYNSIQTRPCVFSLPWLLSPPLHSDPTPPALPHPLIKLSLLHLSFSARCLHCPSALAVFITPLSAPTGFRECF